MEGEVGIKGPTQRGHANEGRWTGKLDWGCRKRGYVDVTSDKDTMERNTDEKRSIKGNMKGNNR